MTDVFPAFSLGGVALLKLMERLDPPPIVRGGVVGGLMLLLIGYLCGQLHFYLPDYLGLPAYGAMIVIAGAVIWWNWRDKRASGRS
ncbi:MAG TPA: hypothetical protein VNT42_05160 [Sphingomonas sp.]|nr:hypothetical protein [Sphingomonas sp.]